MQFEGHFNFRAALDAWFASAYGIIVVVDHVWQLIDRKLQDYTMGSLLLLFSEAGKIESIQRELGEDSRWLLAQGF